MPEHLKPLPLPQQCTAIGLVCDNAARQLFALAQAHSRADLVEDIPRLTATARNAAKLARDSLDVLLERLGEKPRKEQR